jgi:hypothetical protein
VNRDARVLIDLRTILAFPYPTERDSRQLASVEGSNAVMIAVDGHERSGGAS